MFERDLLVGLIAIGLGGVLLVAAISNYQPAFEMRTPKFLAKRFGQTIARLIIGCVGTLVLLMGIYILLDSPSIRNKLQPATGTSLPNQHLPSAG